MNEDDDEDLTPKGPTPQQKLERKAQQAQDGAKAWVEYKDGEAAMRKRTAKLRAQRLAREAKEAASAKEAAAAEPATPKKKKS